MSEAAVGAADALVLDPLNPNRRKRSRETRQDATSRLRQLVPPDSLLRLNRRLSCSNPSKHVMHKPWPRLE